MTALIPDSHRDLLVRPIVVSLATLMPDNQPQVNPVWADVVENQVRINTAKGRTKYNNLAERPMVTVLAVDPDNSQRYLEIRGQVASMSEADGDEVIDKLAKDYMGVDVYPYHNDAETRVTILINPSRVMAAG